jgi:hypothetical protein
MSEQEQKQSEKCGCNPKDMVEKMAECCEGMIPEKIQNLMSECCSEIPSCCNPTQQDKE